MGEGEGGRGRGDDWGVRGEKEGELRGILEANKGGKREGRNKGEG